MKRHYPILLVILILGSLLVYPSTVLAQDAQPVVHAVLFYSPTCPHCHLVMTETLPPLLEKYGPQLRIVNIDITQPQGDALFLAALRKYGVEQSGVPFLIVGDVRLVGSQQIPAELPGLIEAGLAQGGVDWPEIPGLQDVIARSESTQGVPASEGWRGKFAQDPAANTLSVVVLVGMLASLVWANSMFQRTRASTRRTNKNVRVYWTWLIPALSVVGLVIAGYLAYVEAFDTTAACGPVGDCNSVQHSEYARLFGLLPIGVMGLAGYVAILAAWLTARYARNDIANLSGFALLVMTVFGTLFSIYLTFLEPFVIGASCAWCLSSAVVMTVLMLVSVVPGKRAWVRR